MSLRRAHPPPEPAPLPTGDLLSRSERRPGELYEVVALDERTALALADKAQQAGVSAGVALTLLVELELLNQDLTDARAHLTEPLPAAPEMRLGAAEANYIRWLAIGRQLKRRTYAHQSVAVPVRLLTRMTQATITSAVEGDLDRAIRWEAAAVTAGRTIGELGLLLSLRAAADR